MESMREELLEGLKRGITLRFEGEELRKEEVNEVLMIAEQNDFTYMRDFEADASGHIIGLQYDRVAE